MKPHNRPTRDALARMRAALLDLMQAERFTEANELAALIERIEPPAPVAGEAVSAARPAPGAIVPPVASGPATFRTPGGREEGPPFNTLRCSNCDEYLPAHCTTHLLPCCPGSLMHGQDEGTWTPSAPPSL